MKTITYIDLGTHKEGKEIDMFLEACHGLDVDVRVYGVEAHSVYAREVFQNNLASKDVTIFNYAIGAKECVTKLYLSNGSGGHGNSIYATKNNVDVNDYIEVQQIRFSRLLDQMQLSDINILKYNIEGAEYELIKDIHRNKLADTFHIYCGAPSDMEKVGELVRYSGAHLNNMEQSGINRMDFFHCPPLADPQTHIAAMRKRIIDLL